MDHLSDASDSASILQGCGVEPGTVVRIVKYFSNHKPYGAVCKFCLRKDTEPNPYEFQLDKQPYLPWRREFGKECAICSYAILANPSYAAKDKSDIIEENKKPEKLQTYLQEVVQPYEKSKNDSHGKKLYGLSSKVAVTVTANTYSNLEYKKLHGILWPVSVYIALEVEGGKAPNKKLIQTHVIDGKKIRGVLRDPKFGCPLGCYELASSFGTGVEKSSVLGNSAEDLENGTEEIFQAAQKRNRLSGKVVSCKDQDGKETTAMRVLGPAVDGEDSSDDNELLNSIWGQRVVADDEDDECDGGPGKGKKRKVTKQAGAAKTKAKLKTGSGTNGDASTRSALGLRKAHQEFDMSDQVTLLAKQLRANLKEPQTYLTVTVKNFESVKSKVDARLSVDLVNLYGSEAGGDRGLAILDALREHASSLSALANVVACLHATEGERATAEALIAALSTAKAAGAEVAEKAFEVASLRCFRASLSAKRWDRCKALLDTSSKGDGDEVDPLALTRLPATDAGNAQITMVTKGMCDLCMLEDTEENAKNLLEFVTQMQQASFVNTCFREDLRVVYEILSAAVVDDVFSLQAKQRQYEQFAKTKSSRLFKPLTLFPTGMKALSLSIRAFDQAQKDKGLEPALATLFGLVRAVEIPNGTGTFKKDNLLILASKTEMQNVLQLQAQINSSASKKFLDAKATELQSVVDLQDKYFNKVKTAARELCYGPLSEACQWLLPDRRHAGADWEALAAEKLDLAISLAETEHKDLATVLPEPLLEKFKVAMVSPAEFARALKKASAWYAASCQVCEAHLVSQDKNDLVSWFKTSDAQKFDDLGMKQDCQELVTELRGVLLQRCVLSFIATVGSLKPFIVALETKAAKEVISSVVDKSGDAADWEAMARASAVMQNDILPMCGEAVIHDGLDIQVACHASRFFELSLSIAAIKQVKDSAGTDTVQFAPKFLELWTSFVTAYENAFKLLAARSGSESTVEKLQGVLTAALEMAQAMFDVLALRIATAVGKYYENIAAAGAHNETGEFSKAVRTADFINDPALVTRLLEICASENATSMFENFLSLDSLLGANESLFNRMEKILAGKHGSVDQLEALIKNWREAMEGAKRPYHDQVDSAAKVLGHMCVVQAVMRTLEPGETRQGLLAKCQKAINKRWYLKCDPHMQLLVMRGQPTGL